MITWRRFARIPLDGAVPHPTTLMKLTTRCGSTTVAGLNGALLAKATEAKVLRTARLRADTTVVPSNVSYPTDSGLLAKAIGRIAATQRRIQAAGGATRTAVRNRSRSAGKRAHAIGAKLRSRSAAGRDEALAAVRRTTGSWPTLRSEPQTKPSGCSRTPSSRCVGPAPRPRSRGQTASATPPPGAAGADWRGRSTTWPTWSRRPDRSPRRPANGWPGRPRTAPPGESACTTPTPARSPRDASASPWSSATRRRSSRATTA